MSNPWVTGYLYEKAAQHGNVEPSSAAHTDGNPESAIANVGVVPESGTKHNPEWWLIGGS
jgi:hypothetical protein